MDTTDACRRAQLDGEAWRVRLSVICIAHETLIDVFRWRDVPLNRDAYDAAERAGRMRAVAVETAEQDWKA